MSAYFARFSQMVSDAVGKPVVFVLALAGVLVWAASGPVFHYSEIWQLVINTATTIVTFLMIFVLQNTQNRDSQALQAKLDELILTSTTAENRFIGIEKLEDHELHRLKALIEAHCSERDLSCDEETGQEAEKEQILPRAVVAAPSTTGVAGR